MTTSSHQEPHKFGCIIPTRIGSGPPAALESFAVFPGDLKQNCEVLVVWGDRPSLQRNVAAERVKDQILYFIDDDALIDPVALRSALEWFQNQEVVVVGGPALTRPQAHWLEKLFGVVMAHPLVSGITWKRHAAGSQSETCVGEEFTLCNLLVRKDFFQQVAGFEDSLHPGEDPELLKRMRKAGGKLAYVPTFHVWRKRRKNFRELCIQFYRYGRGRSKHILKGLRLVDLLFFLPSLLIVLVATFFIEALFTVGSFLAVCYGVAVCMVAWGSLRAMSSLRALLVAPLAMICIHISYGLGFLSGFLLPGQLRSSKAGVVKMARYDLEKLALEFIEHDTDGTSGGE